MQFNIKLSDFDLRPFGTIQAINALRKYLAIMERQMEEVHRNECTGLELKRPIGGDETEMWAFKELVGFVDDAFENDLIPTMRYSFVVFIHIVFETRLYAFCADLERERKPPVALSAMKGPAIDLASEYLSKHIGIKPSSFSEWQHLANLQKVRDSIVHNHGKIGIGGSKREKERDEHLRQLARQGKGVTLTEDSRLELTRDFCEQQLAHLEHFFRAIFVEAGWSPLPETTSCSGPQ